MERRRFAVPYAIMSARDRREFREYRDEVERVIRSPQFRRAPKLQRFLTLVCDYYFENRPDEINEYLIASEAFGKGPEFDPGVDSLVRVQAREVRRRLREYYQQEGRDSRAVLSIPVGGYVPFFSAPGPQPEQRAPSPMPLWTRAAIVTLSAAVIILSAGWWISGSRYAAAAPAAGSTGPLVSRLWGRFLSSDVPTVLVVSNPDVGECREPDTPTANKNGIPCPDEYTGMGEAVAINLISTLFQARNKPLIVKQSRMVNEDDVRRYNLILLGGKMVNAWTKRLGSDLSLAAESQSSPTQYQTTFDEKTGQLISDRGMIALRRYPATGHWLLFLFGKHTQGTYAAAEGATDERFLSHLGWSQSLRPLPDQFRVLVGVAVSDGIAEAPVPVGLRVP